MFKKTILFSLFIISESQSQAFFSFDSWSTKLNVEKTFEKVRKEVDESRNQYAQEAFDKLEHEKEAIKAHLNKCTESDINDATRSLKCKLVPYVCKQAKPNTQEQIEFLFKREPYRKILLDEYEQTIKAVTTALKKCSSLSDCDKKLSDLFYKLLLIDLIRK